MRRLLRYFRPFVWSIVAAIVLLFIQANADLALPDYMSRIVNVGLQQGGIERALPEAMRATTWQHLALFMPQESQNTVLAHYTRLEPTSPDAAAYVERYPALAEEAIYILNPVDDATRDELEALLSRPLLMVAGLQMLAENPEQAAALFPSSGGFDLSKLPPGTDIFALVARMPEDQRLALLDAIDTRFETLGGERGIVQAATRAVRAEYEALGMDVGAIQNRYIIRVGGLMLLVAAISAIATIVVGLLAARVAAGLARDLRHYLYERVMRFSGAEFNQFSTASLITRATNDITQIQTAVAILIRLVFYAPLIGIGGIIRALDKSPSMWWTIALAVLLLLGLIGTVFAIAIPKFKLMQELIDRLNLVARENLVGMMVVRAFNREAFEEERFDRANRDLTQTTLFINRVFVVVFPAMMLLLNGSMILILWVGAHQVAQASMQVGDMMAFMQYAMQIVFAFMMLSMVFILFPRADVSANRVADVLETPITILDPPNPKPFPEPFEPSIEFDHVSFRYPGAEEDVLHEISFRIEPGQTVGIMGTTGSGKSTVVNLIPRFFDVTDGAIRVSGVDIREVSLRELRDKIGYVPQKSNLFKGTIESNLRFADENADEETLIKALRIAQADFVFELPNGLQTEVAQGGVNFSGGQRQRLTIARALVKRAPIYIFDDSFSALDYKTDARLRAALLRELSDSTVIIVSQRVATVKNADQILVFDAGRLIGRGTHEELMQTCDVYREIAESQLKQEALQ
ncbi:ATP-binding cassette, subfamily B, bacterial [Ardenticatena maritima]|uniref:ABC transporter n=1 Tax=Ardenticatena maritima TaxID=872965 RepID=A0A0M8K6W9_9CHLR|nr:ABC transporter ATP-binding protein [Ardenticatena maritima]KPL86300.1 ABC transporter [Ardenticatena maritima]GAP63015.1 ATP-binding cassette, subfamily B, bacterial [Ardenticatena maritima]